ncbi:MAG: hypothetical protein JF626_15675 [Polaromonas sp.]|nr:hypothetical protein [Polaromonas sp.]
MALIDLTLDTNVLLHCCNQIEIRHDSAVEFVTALLASLTNIAIDEGFDIDPAKNRSLIGSEYLSKLVPGTLPSSLISHLALTGRISIYKSSVNAQLAKKLNQLVTNKRDRTFVKVCSNSSGKVMVSHDFRDFSASKRKTLNNIFSIAILEADACTSQL